MLDGALLASLLLFGPLLAETVGGAGARLLNRAALLTLVLYEPVLVSVWGSTVGHRLLNLEVVSSVDGGRLSFLRAFVRFVVKTGLGLLSLLAIAFTARHQALHDLAAGAVVRMRDPARARPGEFAPERVPEPVRPGGPSPLRRAGATTAYLAAALLLGAVSLAAVVSPGCLDYELCSPAERDGVTALVFLWIAAMAALVVLGWRGRLPGARRRVGCRTPPEVLEGAAGAGEGRKEHRQTE